MRVTSKLDDPICGMHLDCGGGEVEQTERNNGYAKLICRGCDASQKIRLAGFRKALSDGKREFHYDFSESLGRGYATYYKAIFHFKD